MAISLDDLTTPMSVDDVTTSIYEVLAALGVNTTTWKPGAVVRTIIAACAVVLSAFSELMALIAKSGWLELAEGNWLKLVAIHVFGINESDLEATFASGNVTLTNGGGGVYGPFAVDDVVVKNTATGKTFRNAAPFSLGALSSVTVTFTAVEAGSGSTSAPGAIDSLVTTMLGVTVSNATSLVGSDDLDDPTIRTLCLEKRSALSPNGPRDAYAYFARTARRQDGTLVGVTRVAVSKSSTTGQVTVTVASDTGGISGIATDPTTDLGAVDLAIKQNVVPDAVTETTLSATSVTIPIVYTVWVSAALNMTAQEVQDAITAKLISFFSTQPIGGVLIGLPPGVVFADAIRTAIGSTRPEILHVVLSSPAADVPLGATDVPLLGAVTCTAVNVVST